MVEVPRVGVGVIIMRGDKVLLGKRKGSHGSDSWSFPGGHLEMYESFFDCAERETMEETGLKIDVIRELPIVTNDFLKKKISIMLLSISGRIILKMKQKL